MGFLRQKTQLRAVEGQAYRQHPEEGSRSSRAQRGRRVRSVAAPRLARSQRRVRKGSLRSRGVSQVAQAFDSTCLPKLNFALPSWRERTAWERASDRSSSGVRPSRRKVIVRWRGSMMLARMCTKSIQASSGVLGPFFYIWCPSVNLHIHFCMRPSHPHAEVAHSDKWRAPVAQHAALPMTSTPSNLCLRKLTSSLQRENRFQNAISGNLPETISPTCWFHRVKPAAYECLHLLPLAPSRPRAGYASLANMDHSDKSIRAVP